MLDLLTISELMQRPILYEGLGHMYHMHDIVYVICLRVGAITTQTTQKKNRPLVRARKYQGMTGFPMILYG